MESNGHFLGSTQIDDSRAANALLMGDRVEFRGDQTRNLAAEGELSADDFASLRAFAERIPETIRLVGLGAALAAASPLYSGEALGLVP